MFKISGLDQFTRQLEQAQQALAELDGDLGVVNFDPHEPASIEAAIQEVEILIDSKIAPWANNPLVQQVAEGMKEHYREVIIERAASTRLGAVE